MQITQTPLKPLTSMELSKGDEVIIKWIRSAKWEPVNDAPTPIPYTAKVPEFFGGTRLFNMQAGSAGGGLGALELFIKKLQHQGIIGKQELYPLSGHGSARTLRLKKADLDNLGVGKPVDDEDEE